MDDKQRLELERIFQDAGYNNQVEVARALVDNGTYNGKKVDSLRVYINQIMMGHRTASKKLAENLAQICENKYVIEILKESHSRNTRCENGLVLKMEEIFDTLRSKFDELDGKTRWKCVLILIRM